MRVRVEDDEGRDLVVLKTEIEKRIRRELVFQAAVELVPKGTLAPQGGMKTRLVDSQVVSESRYQ